MEGEVLEVSGVSVKLVPQTNDTFVIEPGTYDLLALEGSGNVQSDNYTFVEAYDVTETATYDSEAEGQSTTCTTNVSGDVETVDCMELKNYAELQQNLSIQVSTDQE